MDQREKAYDEIDQHTKRDDEVIKEAEKKKQETEEYNRTATDHLTQLRGINQTATSIEASLNMSVQNLVQVREQLENLTAQLKGAEVPDNVIETAKMVVAMGNNTINNNEALLSELVNKLEKLEDSSDELEKKYKELKQHRDLLQHIMNNIGEYPCTT